MEYIKTIKIACKKTKGNPNGYFVCNADQKPKGAKLFKEQSGKDD